MADLPESAVICIPDEVFNDPSINLWEWVKPQLEASIAEALARQQASGETGPGGRSP
jgi:hypothetical protein